MSINFINFILNSRLLALIFKEINQITRDKNLLIFLLIPPTLQLLIYGYSLNPDIERLNLGVIDYAQTYQSRELVSALVENEVFLVKQYFWNEKELSQQVQEGNLTVGLLIPPDFSHKLTRNQTTEVQIIIDGVDANTAGVAEGYMNQIIEQYNRRLNQEKTPLPIILQTIFLYNPGLVSSWFFVPGMMGVIFTLTSSLVSSGTVVREKDTGTLEQLLMTPADTWEILLAKIIPLFTLLVGDIFLALGLGILVFHVPFNGNLLLFITLSGLYLFVGIGIGIMLATLSSTQQQAFLLSFFINLPLIQLSGAIAPIESMPIFLKYLSLLNPLRHYVEIIRGIMLRGVGLDVLWPQTLALLGFAIPILLISINRFRRQLL